MSTLSAQQLSKSFDGRQVVNNVSLDVKSGEIVGLLGPNGAGKTTCFYMIVGLIPVDNGAIHLNRQELSHERIHNRAQLGIGYLPQEASIFRKLSVEDNIFAIVETRDDLDNMAKSGLLEKLLNDFNISHILSLIHI